ESSSAARCPTWGSAPAPRPRVSLSPILILWGASLWRSAWASVFTAMNSTPIISARIIRFTALLPPPPTPITLMSAKCSASDRSGMVVNLRCAVWSLATRLAAGSSDSSERPRARSWVFSTEGRELIHSLASWRGWRRLDSTGRARGSAGEDAPDPVHHAATHAAERRAGRVGHRLLACMASAPQQQPDRCAECRVRQLVHQAANPLRPANADRHLEDVPRQLGSPGDACPAAGKHHPCRQHAGVAGPLHLLDDERVDLTHPGLDDLAQLAAL